jgi:hypothetical protein
MKKFFHRNKYRFQYKIAKLIRFIWNPYDLKIPTGYCPVQVDGYLNTGEWYYFRSRYNRWYVMIAKSEKHWEDNDLIFGYEDFFDDEYMGGWISPSHAYLLLNKGIRKYYERKNKKI